MLDLFLLLHWERRKSLWFEGLVHENKDVIYLTETFEHQIGFFQMETDFVL